MRISFAQMNYCVAVDHVQLIVSCAIAPKKEMLWQSKSNCVELSSKAAKINAVDSVYSTGIVIRCHRIWITFSFPFLFLQLDCLDGWRLLLLQLPHPAVQLIGWTRSLEKIELCVCHSLRIINLSFGRSTSKLNREIVGDCFRGTIDFDRRPSWVRVVGLGACKDFDFAHDPQTKGEAGVGGVYRPSGDWTRKRPSIGCAVDGCPPFRNDSQQIIYRKKPMRMPYMDARTLLGARKKAHST